MPFLDGTVQMKQNNIFLLKAAKCPEPFYYGILKGADRMPTIIILAILIMYLPIFIGERRSTFNQLAVGVVD